MSGVRVYLKKYPKTLRSGKRVEYYVLRWRGANGKDYSESLGRVGKITKNEYWGLKSLSYRIKKNRKAHYSLLNIDAPHAAVAEMERQMRINEDILRFMTVRVDALEEGPSAMMAKRDRDDDRGDRSRGDRFGDRRPRRF